MKAAIFDLDGTILDSMGMWRTLERDLLTGLGISPTDTIFARMDTLGLHSSATWLIETFHLDKTPEEILVECDRLALQGYLGTVSPKPGVLRVLQALRDRGVKTSLATLTAHGLVDRVLAAKGIAPLLDEILTVEDVGGVKKHRPDLFLKAASLLGAQPRDTVVFEDSLYAIKTAVAAGFPVWAVHDPAAAADEEEIRRLSTRYIERWDDLADELAAQTVSPRENGYSKDKDTPATVAPFFSMGF